MEELNAGGYTFLTKEDAMLARMEIQKIEMIHSKLDFNNIQEVQKVYTNAIEQRVFYTPVGIGFLHELQDILIEHGIDASEIRMIPMSTVFAKKLADQDIMNRRSRKQSFFSQRKNKLSFYLNAILIVLIIIMFSVALNSKNPNILNYKRNLINQYSEWKEELTQREQVIREKELELKISENE